MSSIAQNTNTFQPSVLLGVNPSQIQGDDIAGYDYFGLVGGLRLDTRIKDNMSLRLDLLYSQKGSSGALFLTREKVGIKLSALDIPVSFVVKDWYNNLENNESYYRLHFQAGLTYSRLIDIQTDGYANFQSRPFSSYFIKNLFEWNAGVTFYINKDWGLDFRYNRAINNLIDKNTRQIMGGEPLKLFYITFKVVYTI